MVKLKTGKYLLALFCTVPLLAQVYDVPFAVELDMKKLPKKVSFQSKRNGMVYDRKTKLTWMKCAIGQTFSGGKCSGRPTKYNFSQGLAECSQLKHGGYSDWRMPTLYELKHLVFCKYGPATPLEDEMKCDLPDRFYKDSPESKATLKSLRPVTYQKYFPNTRKYGYWAMKKPKCTYPADKCRAMVDFGRKYNEGGMKWQLGIGTDQDKWIGRGDKYVRCVRGDYLTIW